MFPREKTKVGLVHNISFWPSKKKHCDEVNSSAFALPNIFMLTANDKQTILQSILRKVNLAKNISFYAEIVTNNTELRR